MNCPPIPTIGEDEIARRAERGLAIDFGRQRANLCGNAEAGFSLQGPFTKQVLHKEVSAEQRARRAAVEGPEREGTVEVGHQFGVRENAEVEHGDGREQVLLRGAVVPVNWAHFELDGTELGGVRVRAIEGSIRLGLYRVEQRSREYRDDEGTRDHDSTQGQPDLEGSTSAELSFKAEPT